MKKQFIKTVSFVLVFVIIAVMFVGCDIGGYNTPGNIFSDGYTGGFGLQPGSPIEYWQVSLMFMRWHRILELLQNKIYF